MDDEYKDKELTLIAVKGYIKNLIHIPQRLLTEEMNEYLVSNGIMDFKLSTNFNFDNQVINSCIQNNPDNIFIIDPHYIDKNLVKTAIAKKPSIIEFINQKFLDDETYLLAITVDKTNIRFLPKDKHYLINKV